MFIRYRLNLLLAAGVACALTGCSTIGYYAQSVTGQVDVLSRRQSIATLVNDETQSPQLRNKLETVLRIRRYASAVLKLPDNGSYTSYVQLGRPYAVWNVFAAPELSLTLKEWCFPVAGCVRYRGYFKERAAQVYADGLAAEGYDTYVGGALAYSTLGWFEDPVFSTLMGLSDARLAGVIFHELAHQRLYVEDDTAFNEGFAMTVELEGVESWLKSNGTAAEAAQYHRFLTHEQDFIALAQHTTEQLQALYASGVSAEEKRRGKERLFAAMGQAYEKLKRRWDGDNGYDAWFASGLNNAKLAALDTYREYVPWFQQLFRRTGGDFAAFYREAAAVGDLPQAQRLARLQQAASGKM